MESSCGGCGRNLHGTADARACSYGCTFCDGCAETMSGRCPNCGGDLVALSSGA